MYSDINLRPNLCTRCTKNTFGKVRTLNNIVQKNFEHYHKLTNIKNVRMTPHHRVGPFLPMIVQKLRRSYIKNECTVITEMYLTKIRNIQKNTIIIVFSINI